MKKIVRFSFIITTCLYSFTTCLCDTEEKDAKQSPIDLTLEISTETPCIPKKYAPKIEDIEIKNAVYNDACYPHMISIPSGGWTSIAAPSLSDGNWKNVNTFTLSDFMVDTVIVDLSKILPTNGAKISVDDIKSFERKYGIIKDKLFVIIYTGWSKNWDMEQRGYMKKYPILTKDAADYLAKKSLIGIGIDAPHLDSRQTGLQVQDTLFSKGMYIVRNISKDVEQVAGKSGKIIIAPLKFENSNESPARVIFIPNEEQEHASVVGRVISKIKGMVSND